MGSGCSQHHTPTTAARSLLGVLLLIAVPWSYICVILAVLAHELIGHGLVAVAVNGRFDGFAVMPDGMGWATITGGDHPCMVLLGGVITTTLFGMGALVAAFNRRIGPLVRLLLSILALTLLLEGLPYLFWNSVFPRLPGDIGRVFELSPPSAAVRWGLVGISGISMVAAVWLGSLALWRAIEGIVGPMTLPQAAAVAVTVIAMPGVAYNLAFDWNQIIQDVGQTPSLVNSLLHGAAAVLVIRFREKRGSPAVIPRRTLWGTGVAMWLMGSALVAAVMIWTRHGVSWA